MDQDLTQYRFSHRSSVMRSTYSTGSNAPKLAISMLKPDDIVSIIAYESTAEILLPATVQRWIGCHRQDSQLRPKGSTALSGTEMGGNEVSKFLDQEQLIV